MVNMPPLPQTKIEVALYPRLLIEYDLSVTDGVLLDMIMKLTIRFGFCALPKAELAANLNISIDSVFKRLRKLKERNLIVKIFPTDEQWREYWKKRELKETLVHESCYQISQYWLMRINKLSAAK